MSGGHEISRESMLDLTESLTEAGFRLTSARRVICATLTATGGHLTPDELVEAVRERDAGIGRMTVYRTLEILCDLGQVRPVYLSTGAAHYVVLENGHHHHLVCNQCGQVIEFSDCVIEPMAEVISERFDFVIEGHLLELYGRCGACRKSE
jgi:Fur family ferric uptake transcriptional regulator